MNPGDDGDRRSSDPCYGLLRTPEASDRREPYVNAQILREVESPSEGTLEGIVDAVACDTEEDHPRDCPHPSTPSAE